MQPNPSMITAYISRTTAEKAKSNLNAMQLQTLYRPINPFTSPLYQTTIHSKMIYVIN